MISGFEMALSGLLYTHLNLQGVILPGKKFSNLRSANITLTDEILEN
jgi:hypothetical protein